MARAAPEVASATTGAFWPRLLLFTAVWFVVVSAWSLATPLFSGPDEPSQVTHAAAVARGQWVGQTVGSRSSATTRVVIPGVFSDRMRHIACFVQKPDVSAGCQPPFDNTTSDVGTLTYIGRYPPLYYLAVGLPSRWLISSDGLWAMRLAGAFVASLLLGLATTTIIQWGRSRASLVGLLLATTPAALYIGSVVNSSGLETASAVCFWTAGAVLVVDRATNPPTGLLAVVGVSGVLCCLSRPLSPLWIAVALVVLAVAAGPARLSLLVRRKVWVVLGALAVSALGTVWWDASQHAFDLVARPAVRDNVRIAHLTVNKTPVYLKQMVGIVGWNDAVIPLADVWLWGISVAVVVIAALVRGRRAQRVALAGLAALVVLIPAVIQFDQARRVGFVYQGRYTLPLAVGLPILAAAVLGPRLTGLLRSHRGLGLYVLVQLSGFAAVVRRYTVGNKGTLFYWRGSWQPLPGAVGVTFWYLAGLLILVAVVWHYLRRPEPVPPDRSRDPIHVDRRPSQAATGSHHVGGRGGT